MRLDYVTIFPEYFSVLEVSLVGKAIASGLLNVGVHDLRQWTHDVHRSVDDTPFGGGAGMVMKPQPWGEALDTILGRPSPALTSSYEAQDSIRPPVLDDSSRAASSQRDDERTCLIIPTPSGDLFTQEQARQLAGKDRIVFACGRYEGIDARVGQYARGVVEVRELSLGDYVLNGGEVAALAMTEAIVRLLPGVIGNPQSLTEESHSDSLGHLLEYPVYTKPAAWRGFEVPEVLLSGHHAKIAQWRHDQAVRLTAQRRPDLLQAPSASPASDDPDDHRATK
ncbi:MAG: tRNA (guanosine(37)-N1)-methyltransferase TrmD [Propionibacteriaceae bacterium]|jgi:tRNA (guanine37-N1)-methyltransferase|nr:tRNA (guanosine(37)-N1)-methyltransferase TrmD [Propionibacteriaceae bacterium]